MNARLDLLRNLIGQEAMKDNPSPFGKWLNGKLLEAEEGKLKLSFTVRKEFTNPLGIIHGGVLAGIIDESIGMTSYSLGLQDVFVALNLNVDFLRPAFLGEELFVSSEVIRSGKTLLHLDCVILNKKGKIIAKASSNMVKTAVIPT